MNIIPNNFPNNFVFKRYKDSFYYVSKTGLVFSVRKNTFLVPRRRGSKKVYIFFAFYCNGIRMEMSLHRLLAECFIPNPKNHPVVRHLDDNSLNNNISNLAWGTHQDNHHDAAKNNRHKNRMSIETVLAIRKEYDKGINIKTLVIKYGKCMSQIQYIINRKRWKNF